MMEERGTVERRTFGRTGLRMPVLSAGGMRFMQSWEDRPLSEIAAENQRKLEATLARAIELGITHIETARGYGSSERQLGRALKRFDRDRLIIQTKIGPQDDPDRFEAFFMESLERLDLRRVDLLAIHGINDHRGLWQSCRPGGCLARARALQRRGLADWIGFSTHGPTDVLLSAVEHGGDGGFDYLNLHWYTIFQCHTPVLEAAKNADMGVFIISPTDKGGMLHSPPAELVELSRPLLPLQFNDLFCLARPEVHTISIGAQRPDDYDAHAAALRHLGDTELVQAIHRRWQDRMEERTGVRDPDEVFARFPPFHATPGYINIPFVLWLDNLARGWGLTAYARERYQKLGREMPWVAGNHGAHAQAGDLEAVARDAGWPAGRLVRRLHDAHARLGP